MGFRAASRIRLLGLAMSAGLVLAPSLGGAQAAGTLRIAMTSSDIPTTTSAPDNGYEGIRFLGYPAFEGLTLWDLRNAVDKVAEIKPGLAESWEQDATDKSKWIFHLRKDVTFHDGSKFDADAVIWNFDRWFKKDSPQADPAGAATMRARVNFLTGYRKIDDYTVEFINSRPISFFPNQLVTVLFASPAQFAKTGSWAAFAKAPAGTGPFKITEVKPRESVTLVRNDDYWDKNRIPKLDKMILYPIPEPTTRLSALRSGQVDWIEAPPPDAVPSLKSAGFQIVTGSYPHIWSWELNMAKPDTPWADIRVRHAVNYCIDRKGLVTLLNGLAEPASGIFKEKDPHYGSPKEHYTYDPAKARALMKEAGYTPEKPLHVKVMISTSGSGQMMPIPMNELVQQNLKECGFDVAFEVVEWGTMLVANRNPPTAPQALGVDALNISLPAETDVALLGVFTRPSNAPPKGLAWSSWKNDAYDSLFTQIEQATDPKEILSDIQKAHAMFVDEAPWVFIVHDLNPRAMTKKVKGFTSAQSWFQDFTTVYME